MTKTMTKTKIKTRKIKRSIKTTSRKNPRLILKVTVYVPVAKTINGSISQGNMSYMMELHPIPYNYGATGKEKKIARAKAYRIKGLRGGLRHKVMQMCLEAGLEVCHSSSKTEDKHGNSLLPAGFHAQGTCLELDQECIVHHIFGDIRQTSKIIVNAPPLVHPKHDTAEFTIPVQKVRFGVENCTAMTYDGKSIQNFKHHYFSGQFYFEIDVTASESDQLGLLLEAVTHLEKIGGGYNSGYGHISQLKFTLLFRFKTKKRTWDGDGYVIRTEQQEEVIQDKMDAAFVAWQQCLQNKSALAVPHSSRAKEPVFMEV